MTKPTTKTRPNRAIKERTPLGGNRNVLTTTGVPKGYIGRFVNDANEGLRITNALAGGYEFVTAEGITVGDRSVNNEDSSDRKKGSAVITKNVGNGVTAYLMAIKKELYKEDQEAKQENIAAHEADMLRNINSGNDGTYGGIKAVSKNSY